MFTAAAAAAFSGAGTAVVSAVTAVTAVAAVMAGMIFCIKIISVLEECFAFSAKKNRFGLFIKSETGRSISPLFICAVVAYKVAVGYLFSAFTGYGNAVWNIVMSLSAVFAFAVFLFRGNRLLFINQYR